MRIINLVENTGGVTGCGFEHGLSFYIETEKHKLLVDTGASDLFSKNAEKLGVDLTRVDTVVLSHGHYDHGGGILPFVKISPAAKIYIQASAFAGYYSLRDGAPRYIGLAEEIRELPQVVIVGGKPSADAAKPEDGDDGIFRIDDELCLFSGIGNTHPIPAANRNLKIKAKGGLIQDDFRHEQCLVVSEGGKTVLLSGCAHHGILNILDRYRELFGGEPDIAISGFHMMKKSGYSDEDFAVIGDTAQTLLEYSTVFYTGHCTGTEPYNAMHKIMGDRLRYVHSGDEIRIPTREDPEILMNAQADKELLKRFLFREAHPDEAEQIYEIERTCFPPNEACPEEVMYRRVARMPEQFLLAVDRETGEIAGFLDGLTSDEESFLDEFFTDVTRHDPAAKTEFLMGLDVLPKYRGQGLAKELMRLYGIRGQARGRHRMVLTAHEEKVGMYEKMGFCDLGISGSVWGDVPWHEMEMRLDGSNDIRQIKR